MTDTVDEAADGLSAARLTTILRSEGHPVEVTDVRVEAVGTGQMGNSFRLTPTYAGHRGELPATFVAKVAGGDPAKRPTAAGAYRTEVGFYRNLAASLSVRVPRCWHSEISDDGTDFLLLLDDVAPAAQGDQIAGCDLARAVTAVENLAGLHGPRWCDPALTTVEGMAPATPDSLAMLAAFLHPATDTFLSRFADRLAPDDADVLRQVPDVAGRWLLGRSGRFAPVHGDYRLDNLMYATDLAVTALDWQTVSLGLPGRDLAYFCETSLTVDDRRAHEHDVVGAYHRALAAHGVGGHSVEECFDDYRYGMLQGPLIIVLGWVMSSPTPRGDEMFMAMTERTCAAIRDHDTFALVPPTP